MIAGDKVVYIGEWHNVTQFVIGRIYTFRRYSVSIAGVAGISLVEDPSWLMYPREYVIINDILNRRIL